MSYYAQCKALQKQPVIAEGIALDADSIRKVHQLSLSRQIHADLTLENAQLAEDQIVELFAMAQLLH